MRDIKILVNEILNDGYLMSLATVDESGPWVSDIIYVADKDFAIYWVSREAFRHSKAIIKDPRVSASITTQEYPLGAGKGVQLDGDAKKLEKIPHDVACAYTAKRQKKKSSKVPWRLADGESWYMLTPINIDLIYEPLFGLTKKSLHLT